MIICQKATYKEVDLSKLKWVGKICEHQSLLPPHSPTIQNLRRAFISTWFYINVACCYSRGFLKPNQFEKPGGVAYED